MIVLHLLQRGIIRRNRALSQKTPTAFSDLDHLVAAASGCSSAWLALGEGSRACRRRADTDAAIAKALQGRMMTAALSYGP
jgi:hypothetical protein